jgi:tetratricopeptide (TPR) repeat protein
MPPSEQQGPDLHALIEEADALNERGAYTEGLRTAERAIDLAGDDAAAWTTKGWSLENLERLLEAEEAYRTALRHDPGSPWAAVGLATVLDKTGRGDQAGDVYRTIADRGLAADEENTDLLEIVGWCSFKAGRNEDAERLFRRCLRLEPGRTAALFDLALTMLAEGRVQDSLAQYRAGLGSPVDARSLRAHVLVALDDLEQAVELVERSNAAAAGEVLRGFLETPLGDR